MLAFRGRIVLLLVTVLMVLRLWGMAVQETYYGPGPLMVSSDIVVPADGTADAGRALAKAGAIHSAWMFRVSVWLTRKEGPIRAGEYFIPARASLAEILDILRRGAPVQHQVTIPEGLTGMQIANILNTAPAASGHVAWPAEGAVLPQTYDYTLGTKRAELLARAEAALRQNLGTAWAERDPKVPLSSPQDALTLASIVQQETPKAVELPEIAAVYENRLKLGMRLQADPTVIYAASGGRVSGGEPISRDDLANPSVYNTYAHYGLPPGPICAPGIAAIEAVLHPATSRALYFVASGDGGHVFANDFKTQLRNIALYRNLSKDSDDAAGEAKRGNKPRPEKTAAVSDRRGARH